jgi:YggT family protein
MSGYFTDAGLFLIKTLFGLYILAVLLRFLLQLARADFYNPLAKFLVTLTNPPLKPLRRIIPGLYGIDLASIVLLLLLEIIQYAMLAALRGLPIDLVMLAASSVFDLLETTLQVYFFAILLRVILSWLNPYPNAASQLLTRLTEPVLRRARQLVPPISGLDLSPMVAGVVIVLLQMLVMRLPLILGIRLVY